MQEWFNTHKSIICNPWHNQTENKKEKKTTNDHLVRCRKDLWQDLTSLHDKSSERFSDARDILNIIKAAYSKPITDINSNGKKLKTVPLKSGTRQSCLLSPYLFTIALEVLARAIREVEKITEIQIRKKEVKVFLFADNMIVYITDTKNFTGKFLQLINTFNKVSKINSQNQ